MTLFGQQSSYPIHFSIQSSGHVTIQCGVDRVDAKQIKIHEEIIWDWVGETSPQAGAGADDISIDKVEAVCRAHVNSGTHTQSSGVLNTEPQPTIFCIDRFRENGR